MAGFGGDEDEEDSAKRAPHVGLGLGDHPVAQIVELGLQAGLQHLEFILASIPTPVEVASRPGRRFALAQPGHHVQGVNERAVREERGVISVEGRMIVFPLAATGASGIHIEGHEGAVSKGFLADLGKELSQLDAELSTSDLIEELLGTIE